jgi:hypothetical protein
VFDREFMESRIFRYALITSLLIHIGILLPLTCYYSVAGRKIEKSIRVTYELLKDQPLKVESTNLEVKSFTEKNRKYEKARLKQVSDIPTVLKDISKFADSTELNNKQPAKVSKIHVERKITVPPLNSEKINNPIYLNYYQIVRNRIKERAYENYSQYEAGEVYLTFVLLSDGSLKELKLIEEKTSANQYLRDVGVKSIQDASPFPPFPRDLRYPELSFNVVISFEVKNYSKLNQ